MEKDRLSPEELIAAVRPVSKVTLRQLERWRDDGLIPSPKRASLGRGKGMRSDYPTSAATQLRRLLELRNNGMRGVHNLRMLLWLDEFAIDIDRLRESLIALAGRLMVYYPDEGEPSEVGELYAADAERTIRRTLIGQDLRGSLPDKNHRVIAISTMFTLAFGGRGFTDQPRRSRGRSDEAAVGEIFERATGLWEGRTAQVGDSGPPVTGPVGGLLVDAATSGYLDLARTWMVLKSASPTELDRARSDLRAFRLAGEMLPYIERITGPFGLSGMSQLRRDNPTGFALLVGFLINVRQSGQSDGLDNFVNACTEAVQMVRKALPEGMTINEATTRMEAHLAQEKEKASER